MEKLGAKPGRQVCEAMRGLVEEAQQEQAEHDEGPILDLVIIASLQRIEHYEIAAYGTMAELANALEETEVAELLAETLAEEKAQDARLTEVTRDSVLPAALSEGEEEAAEQDAEDRPARRRPPQAAGQARRGGPESARTPSQLMLTEPDAANRTRCNPAPQPVFGGFRV